MIESMPIVKAFFDLLKREDVSVLRTAAGAGINPNTIYMWQAHSHPRVDMLVYAGAAIGYELRWVKVRPDHTIHPAE